MEKMNEKNKMIYLAGLTESSNVKGEAQVWFDLDGVLADMQNGLERDEEYVKRKNDLDNSLERDFPQWLNLSTDGLRATINKELKDNPNDENLKRIKKTFKRYNDFVFSIASRPNFYFTLNLMPGALELVDDAYRITGRRPNILSSPVGNEKNKNNPSVYEKKRWVYKNFENHLIYLAQKYLGDIIGNFTNKLFGSKIGKIEITTDKGRVANSRYDILIDDRLKYVEKFREAGGSAILYKDANQAAFELQKLYDELMSR